MAGAVDPNDLVKDPDISPFNVGVEIRLDDFTADETQVLTEHLGDLGLVVDATAHQKIYHWTNGHPYLTQRICEALTTSFRSGSLSAITAKEIDYVVEQLIINRNNVLQRDKNLKHGAKMLNRLSPRAHEIWSQLLVGKFISSEEVIDSIYLELYLIGAVIIQANQLVIRNLIYEKAFATKNSTIPTFPPNQGSKPMKKQPRIFLSSTWQDLQAEREAVEKALHRMQDTSFAGMEYFGSRPETPKQVSLAEVDRSNVYVGIFAHRYGSGITEDEYRRARDRNLPCLIYIKDDSVPIPPAYMEREPAKSAKLEALKHEFKTHHTTSYFKSPDQLATQVVADLHKLLRNSLTQEEAESAEGKSKYQINITHGQGIVIGDSTQVTQYYYDKPGPFQPSEPGASSSTSEE